MTSSPNPQNIQFAIVYDKVMQQILTFEKVIDWLLNSIAFFPGSYQTDTV